MKPNATLLTQMNHPDNQTQLLVAGVTVGCNSCTEDSRPLVEHLKEYGLYRQKCVQKNTYDLEAEDVPCPNIGYVSVKEGYIESEKTLVSRNPS